MINATILFQETWDAIHEVLKDDQGNPILGEDGKPERKYRYIIHEGSSRSSKTQSLIQVMYMYCMKYRVKRTSVWRDTKKDCRDTVGFDMSRIYPSMPYFNTVLYRDSKAYYDYRLTGSVLEINGTDDENKVMGYNGDVAWLNEPYNFSKETFDQIDQRTTEFVLIDWNPKRAHFIEDLKKDSRALVIHSTFKKNPFCPVEQKRKILSYQPVSMCGAVNDGDLTLKAALVYDIAKNKIGLNSAKLKELSRCQDNQYKNSASEYKWSVYGLGIKAEKPNRIFKWKKIRYQEFLNIDVESWYGVDWGKSDPFAIVEVKYLDGCLYVHELNYASENELRERLTPTERAQIGLNDEGLVQWMFRQLGIDPDATIVCDPNRRTKIQALRKVGFDNALEARKPPGSILDGIDLLDNLDVYYTDNSPNIEYEQENYERKKDRYGIVLDEPMDKDNHTIDGIRYVGQMMEYEGIIRIV